MSNDARSLCPEAQEALRRRVVHAVRGGLSQTEAARVFQVARPTVNRWVRVSATASLRALRAKPRGRPVGTQVAAAEAARVVRVILGRCPDQLRLPFALWTREAVQHLLERDFGVTVSVWTVGRYLAAWGLTPQKPLTRAYEQNPVAVRRWLDDDYPPRCGRRPWRSGPRFTGATRWGSARIIMRAEPTAAVGRRQWFRPPGSGFGRT